ncbi:MAG: Dabb family protein [Clostridia bacterium]
MVRHLVMYKVKDKANIQKMVENFNSMKGEIAVLKDVNAHQDFLKSERSFDVILDITVESLADLEAYKAHPYHAEKIKPFVHSIIENSVSVDYEF